MEEIEVKKKKRFLGMPIFLVVILSLVLISAVAYLAYTHSFTKTIHVFGGGNSEYVTISGSGDMISSVMDCPDSGSGCSVDSGTITLTNSDTVEHNCFVTTTGSNEVTVSYIGEVELTTKNTQTWDATDVRKVNVIYTLVGEEFETEVELQAGEVLVYALDHDNRFVDYASVIKVEDVNGDLPFDSDWNANPSPDYCENHNTFDDYEHCNGAKLWIVKESDLGTQVDSVYPLDWVNMNTYLYETDLIHYFDNTNGEIIVPKGGSIDFKINYQATTTNNYPMTTTINCPSA